MQSCVITEEERMNVTHREEGAGKKNKKLLENLGLKIKERCGHKLRNAGNHKKLKKAIADSPWKPLRQVWPWLAL